MNKFFNGSIVALALSCFACASAPKVNVTSLPRAHGDHDGIVTTAESQIYTGSNKPTMVACDHPNSSTNPWTIPASADPNYQYPTRDDAEVALTEIYGAAANRTAIQSCPADNDIAQGGPIKILDENKLVRTADNKR